MTKKTIEEVGKIDSARGSHQDDQNTDTSNQR